MMAGAFLASASASADDLSTQAQVALTIDVPPMGSIQIHRGDVLTFPRDGQSQVAIPAGVDFNLSANTAWRLTIEPLSPDFPAVLDLAPIRRLPQGVSLRRTGTGVQLTGPSGQADFQFNAFLTLPKDAFPDASPNTSTISAYAVPLFYELAPQTS